MSGYLGTIKNQGRPGYDSSGQTPTGLAWLARDTTVLEMPDRGWTNLPPWGYARQRGSMTFAPAGLSGLGEVSADAQAAARSLIQAIDMAVVERSSLDYREFGPLIENIADDATREFLSFDVAEFVRQKIEDYLEYGDDPVVFGDAVPTKQIALARARAGMVMTNAISEFQLNHSGMNEREWDIYSSGNAERRAAVEAEIAASQPSLFDKVALSTTGTGVIAAGSFFSGATGFNRGAIEDSARDASGGDAELVGSFMKAGEVTGDAAGSVVKGVLSLVPWYVWLGGLGIVGVVAWPQIKAFTR